MFWTKKKPPRELTLGRKSVRDSFISDELSYGSPWIDRARTIEYDELGADNVVENVYDVEEEGLYDGCKAADALSAVGTGKIYAVYIIDGSGSQVVYTDDNPIVKWVEL